MSESELLERIRRLEDRAEITQLVHEYCRVFDEGNHDAMADLFGEDALIDYGPDLGGEITGREEIRTWLRGIYGFKRTSHHLSNVQVWFDEADPDHARGVCYVLAWHEWPSERPNGVLYGRYEDEYRRTTEGWRIAVRREIQHGQEDFELGWNWIKRKSQP